MADAVLGERDSALREAEHTIMAARTTQALDANLRLASWDLMYGSGYEDCLAIIQTVFGENSRAISTLTRQLNRLYDFNGPAPVTPALLRLDPLWDPLRADPAFQKLCEEKKP
jgi:hypothetical protein